MMYRLVLLSFFASVACSNEYGWKEKTRYVFRIKLCFNDYAEESVPITRSIVMRAANLYIIPLSSGKLSGAIRHVEGRRFLTQGELDSSCARAKGLVVPKGHFSGKPFVINLKKGLVTGITTDKHVPEVELDLIRAIASQFQLDLQGVNCSPETCQRPSDARPNAIYRTVENATVGTCETQYEVSALPIYNFPPELGFTPPPGQHGSGRFFEIVKTIDYDQCRPIRSKRSTHYDKEFSGIPLSVKNTNRVVILGNLKQYIIQSSVSTHSGIHEPDIPNPMPFCILNVTLISTEPFDGPPPNVTYPKAVDLTESYNIKTEYDNPLSVFFK